MTTEQIEILFFETINNKEAYGKALYNQLDGVTENQIYNWRKQRTKATIGDMLNVLYQLKKISILALDKSNRINTIEGLNKLPEIVENIFGKKRTLAPSIRPNSNEPNPK